MRKKTPFHHLSLVCAITCSSVSVPQIRFHGVSMSAQCCFFCRYQGLVLDMVENGHWRQGGAQTANLVAPVGCVAFSVTRPSRVSPFTIPRSHC